MHAGRGTVRAVSRHLWIPAQDTEFCSADTASPLGLSNAFEQKPAWLNCRNQCLCWSWSHRVSGSSTGIPVSCCHTATLPPSFPWLPSPPPRHRHTVRLVLSCGPAVILLSFPPPCIALLWCSTPIPMLQTSLMPRKPGDPQPHLHKYSSITCSQGLGYTWNNVLSLLWAVPEHEVLPFSTACHLSVTDWSCMRRHQYFEGPISLLEVIPLYLQPGVFSSS